METSPEFLIHFLKIYRKPVKPVSMAACISSDGPPGRLTRRRITPLRSGVTSPSITARHLANVHLIHRRLHSRYAVHRSWRSDYAPGAVRSLQGLPCLSHSPPL